MTPEDLKEAVIETIDTNSGELTHGDYVSFLWDLISDLKDRATTAEAETNG